MDERIEKIKEVGKWHFRHFSIRQIAEKTGLSPNTVQKYIAIIRDRMQGMPDVDNWIRDTVARTMEEIDKLNELEIKAWEMLDWASELVPDLDKDGCEQFNPETGQKIMKPRRPGYVTQASGQIMQIGRQRAELLKLIGNKVDLTVNLQFALKVQSVVMEKLNELDPIKYAELHREIGVLADQFEKQNGEKVALPGTPVDPVIIEGEYETAEEYGE